MLAVELQSWKGIAGRGMEQPGVTDFYRRMLRELSETAEARVIMARFEGRDIGFIFGGMLGKIYRGQQFSFVDDWAAGSIGNTLQAEQIKWLCEEGANRYDLGPLSCPPINGKREGHGVLTGKKNGKFKYVGAFKEGGGARNRYVYRGYRHHLCR